MGILLILYFFTFAMLIDMGYSFLLKFEVITSIIFVITFFFLNKLSFQLTKLIYKGHASHRELLSRLIPSDVYKAPEGLQQDIAKRHMP